MRRRAWLTSGRGCVVLAACAALACMPAIAAAKQDPAPTVILRGYRLSGAKGVDADALTAQLKDQAGARVTSADIDADARALGALLKAHHVEGQLFTTVAERDGRAWVLFDLIPPPPPPPPMILELQGFEGTRRVQAEALAAATGLKPGAVLSEARIDAARAAILDTYQKRVPGTAIKLRLVMRRRADGHVRLDWVIDEPK